MVIQGHSFSFQHTQENVGGKSTFYLQMKTGSTEIALVSYSGAVSGGDWSFRLWEEPDIADGSNSINIYNAKRNSAALSEIVFFSNPVINDIEVGEKIKCAIVGGEQKRMAGFLPHEDRVDILLPNSDYVWAFENKDNSAHNVCFRCSWIEFALRGGNA